jgi:hypothetical protein
MCFSISRNDAALATGILLLALSCAVALPAGLTERGAGPSVDMAYLADLASTPFLPSITEREVQLRVEVPPSTSCTLSPGTARRGVHSPAASTGGPSPKPPRAMLHFHRQLLI